MFFKIMAFSIEEFQDRGKWNRFFLEQPTQAGIFLQSWEWLAFQESLGRRVWRLGITEQLNNEATQQLVAVCGVVSHELPFGQIYLYAPRIVLGKLQEVTGGYKKLQEAILKIAEKERAIFWRFEPAQGSGIPPSSRQYRLDFGRAGRDQVSAVVVSQPVQPTVTLIADLSGDDDARLAAMHEKTRYNIRLAERKGVRCQGSGISGEQDGFGEFWTLLEETARRDKFHTHQRSYYEKMMEVLGATQQLNNSTTQQFSVRLWLARHEDKAIAGALVGYFGDTATYLHGASSHEHRNLMAPYALHWEIMRDARAAGFKRYDFWGIDEKKWPGVTRFKKGFGGEVVQYPGAFDLPISRFWYTLYRLGKRVR